MLVFSLCRLVFYIRNLSHFPDANIFDFLSGMWFDAIATCLLFYPLIALELFPNKNRRAKWFKVTTVILTYIIFVFGIFVNLIDIEYFHHTTSRSNFGLFKMLRFGEDLKQQVPSFIVDYWYILILLALFILLLWFSLKKINQWQDDSNKTKIWKQTVIYVIVIITSVIIGRGGFVRKPINPTQAAKFTASENVPLVLNTAFTIINSIDSETIEEKKYFTQNELANLYRTEHQYSSEGRLKGQNVVLIIVESFSPEFIGLYHHDEEKTYTPFFDSLAHQSLFYTNAFANGKKSLDAVPAIVASIPKLMESEYLLSPYAANEIDALPELLSRKGYTSAFFHGATNGSMNFDAFSEVAEFDNYYGRSEYNNDQDYDGTWGIYDHKFMSWSIEQINRQKQPFFNTIFTISNHPPFSIPEKFEKKYSNAPSEQHKTVQYTDEALKSFFNKAKRQSWFKNTLFVITADHTPGTKNRRYSNSVGRLNIPLLFYHPTDTTFKGKSTQITSQIDIMPSILDLLGFNSSFFSFGHSIFSENNNQTAAQVAGEYIILKKYQQRQYFLLWRNEKPIGLYDINDRVMKDNLINKLPKVSSELEEHLKAMIQAYNHHLISNKMTVD